MNSNGRSKSWLGLSALALVAGTLVFAAGFDVVGEAEAAPYTRLVLPYNDGGVIFCRPPVNGRTPLITPSRLIDGGSGGAVNTPVYDDVRTVWMQLREGATAPVRIGNDRVSGTTGKLNGAQLKARETLSWTVALGSMPNCVVENSDAGQVLDVVYGVNGR